MKRFFYLLFKRLTDIILSLVAIAVFLVPMIIIGIIVRCGSRGRAIFKQKRVGKNKKLFTIYKFRTMKSSTPNIPTRDFDNSLSYVTKFGKFLRKTSLDELPQVFNILFGNMSVVGPRPALFNELDQVEERDKYGVNALKPGLTGWAQINGRNASDLYTKTKFDKEYLERASFWFDLKIIFITFFQVIRGKDIEVGKTKEPEAVAVGEGAAIVKEPITVTEAQMQEVADAVAAANLEGAETVAAAVEFEANVDEIEIEKKGSWQEDVGNGTSMEAVQEQAETQSAQTQPDILETESIA